MGFSSKPVAEAGELVVDHLEVFDGIGPARRVGDVDEVGEDAGALDVAQELSAEAVSPRARLR